MKRNDEAVNIDPLVFELFQSLVDLGHGVIDKGVGSVKVRDHFEGRNLNPLTKLLGERIDAGGNRTLRVLRKHRDHEQLGCTCPIGEVFLPAIVHFVNVRWREEERVVDFDITLRVKMLELIANLVCKTFGVGNERET